MSFIALAQDQVSAVSRCGPWSVGREGSDNVGRDSDALGGLIKGWHLKAITDDEVQKLGEEGWELVGLTDIGLLGSTKNVLLVFKRPMQ
jgi:hypothetical protein